MTKAGVQALPVWLAISKLIDKKIALNSVGHPAAIERIEQDILWLEERIGEVLSRIDGSA